MSDRTHSQPASFPSASSGTSVLVVDDNPVVTGALAAILAEAGYAPTTCHSGAEAMASVAAGLPAAAVVDIHLPDVSGLVLAGELRQRLGPGKPIIVLSGDTSMENLRSLSHVGASYFIAKPFNPQRLLDALKEFAAVGQE